MTYPNIKEANIKYMYRYSVVHLGHVSMFSFRMPKNITSSEQHITT